jgi:hypothetical protein
LSSFAEVAAVAADSSGGKLSGLCKPKLKSLPSRLKGGRGE